MMSQMSKVVSSRAIAIIGAGALLANPGVFIPFALKTISETDPSSTQYIAEWVFFTLASLAPLAVAIAMLLVARGRAQAASSAQPATGRAACQDDRWLRSSSCSPARSSGEASPDSRARFAR